MSYDQKPARMRVVSSGSVPAPQRRRGDLPAEAPASTTPAPAATRRGRTTLLVLLFLLGCIAGGIALPLLGLV